MGKKEMDNPFAGFSLIDNTNRLKTTDDSPKEGEETPDLDDMEAKIKAESEEKEEETEEVENKTKEPEKKEEEEKPEIVQNIQEDNDDFSYKPLINHLANKGILDITEEDLKEADFTQDEIVEKVIGKTAESLSNKRIEQYPDELKKAIEWVENGGDIKQFYDYFYNKVKYNDITLDKEDTELQKAILADWLRYQGEEDDERIKTRIEKYELGGILEDESTVALEKLQKLEKTSEEEKLTNQKKQAEAERIKQLENWNNLKKSILEAEEIQGFKITPKQRQQLLDHISKPLKDGKTQLQINNEKNAQKAQLLYAYLDMLNFDITKLEKQVKNKVTSELRSKLGKFTDQRGKSNTVGTADIEREDNPFEAFRKLV